MPPVKGYTYSLVYKKDKDGTEKLIDIVAEQLTDITNDMDNIIPKDSTFVSIHLDNEVLIAKRRLNI